MAHAIADQNATETIPFSYQFQANVFHDADGDTLTYTATQADDSALPARLAFDAASRTFSGTPGQGDVGTLSVKLSANDNRGGVASDLFEITVATWEAPIPGFGLYSLLALALLVTLAAVRAMQTRLARRR